MLNDPYKQQISVTSVTFTHICNEYVPGAITYIQTHFYGSISTFQGLSDNPHQHYVILKHYVMCNHNKKWIQIVFG